MGMRYIVRMFERHSVAVCGMKGSGKDLLMSNVVARRNKPYVCNIDYTQDDRYIPLIFSDLDVKNDYRTLVSGKINKYISPYPDDTDVYISDAGIYLPSQYNSELNRMYPYLSTYWALSRHLNGGKCHINVQNLNRCWDKVREMADKYIYCRYAVVVCGWVIQKVTIYDKASSCVDRVFPPYIPTSFRLVRDQNAEMQKQLYLDKFYNTYGTVKNKLLIYRLKSKYDTRHFKKLLEEGE